MAAVGPASLVVPVASHGGDVLAAERSSREALIARGSRKEDVVTFRFSVCEIPNSVLIANPILRQSCIAASLLFFRMQHKVEEIRPWMTLEVHILKALNQFGIARAVIEQLFGRCHDRTEDGQMLFNFSTKVARSFGTNPLMRTREALEAIRGFETIYPALQVPLTDLMTYSPFQKTIIRFFGTHDLTETIKTRLMEKVFIWCCQNDTPDCFLSNNFLPFFLHHKTMNNQEIREQISRLTVINPKIEKFVKFFIVLEKNGLLELPLQNFMMETDKHKPYINSFKRLNERRLLFKRYMEFELMNNERNSPKIALDNMIDFRMETLKRARKKVSRASVTAEVSQIPANAHLYDLAEKMKRLLRVHRLRSSTLQMIFEQYKGVIDPEKLHNLSYLLHDHFVFCIKHLFSLFDAFSKHSAALKITTKDTMKSTASVLAGLLGYEVVSAIKSFTPQSSYEEKGDKKRAAAAEAEPDVVPPSQQYDLCSFQSNDLAADLLTVPEVFPVVVVGAAAPAAPAAASAPARPDRTTPFCLFLEEDSKSDAESGSKIRHQFTKPMLAIVEVARVSLKSDPRVDALPRHLKPYFGKVVNESLDHLFLAADELEKLLNSIVNGYYQQVHGSIQNLVMHFSIAIEQYLSMQYLLRHKAIPTEHSLVWLATESRMKLTPEEDLVVKQWDKAMVWARFPHFSIKHFHYINTPFPPALRWLQFGLLSYQPPHAMSDLTPIVGEIFDSFQAILKMTLKGPELERYCMKYLSTLVGMKKTLLETIAQKKLPPVCKTVTASEKFREPLTQLGGIRRSINEMLKSCRGFPADQNPTTELEEALHLLALVEDGYLRLSIDGKSGHAFTFAIERLFNMDKLLEQLYRARLVVHQFGPQLVHHLGYYHGIFEQLEEPVKPGDVALVEELNFGKSHHYRQITRSPLHAQREQLLQHRKSEFFPAAFPEMPVVEIGAFRNEILPKLNRFLFVLVDQVEIVDKTINDRANEMRKERAAKPKRVK